MSQVKTSLWSRVNSLPLGRRVALALVAVLIAVVSLFVWYGQRNLAEIEAQFEARATLLAKSIASEGTLGLIMQDDAGLSEQLERVVNTDETIAAAAFFTPDGKRFADSEYEKLVGNRMARRTGVEYVQLTNGKPAIIASAPVVDAAADGAALGTAYAVLFAEDVAGVEKSIWTITGGVTAILVFIVGFMLIAMQRVVVKPVDRLRTAAQQVQAGDLKARVAVKAQDEIGQLSEAFNSMVAEQEQATERLQREQAEAETARQAAQRLQEEAEAEREYLRDRFAEIAVVIDAVTHGDLTQSLQVEREDEVGQLMQKINRMIRDLNGLLHEVDQSTGQLEQASGMVAASAEQMSAGARDQASQTGMVAAAVEEMSVTAAQASTFAEDANKLAREASTLAQQGETVFANTTTSMTRIAGIVREAAENVAALGSSSAQIGEIVEVIGDIASQTNLLALNAAIEAARAGEHGHGFAVVADEVRKLAERTSAATREIADMIKRIQNNTGEVVASMTRGNEESEAGLKLADEASELLSSIVGSIGEMVERIDQIALGSEQQAETSASVARNVEAIAAVSSQASEATHSLTETADQMNRHVEVQRSLISRFQLAADAEQNRYGTTTVTRGGMLLDHSGDGASGDGAAY